MPEDRIGSASDALLYGFTGRTRQGLEDRANAGYGALDPQAGARPDRAVHAVASEEMARRFGPTISRTVGDMREFGQGAVNFGMGRGFFGPEGYDAGDLAANDAGIDAATRPRQGPPSPAPGPTGHTYVPGETDPTTGDTGAIIYGVPEQGGAFGPNPPDSGNIDFPIPKFLAPTLPDDGTAFDGGYDDFRGGDAGSAAFDPFAGGDPFGDPLFGSVTPTGVVEPAGAQPGAGNPETGTAGGLLPQEFLVDRNRSNPTQYDQAVADEKDRMGDFYENIGGSSGFDPYDFTSPLDELMGGR